jgi:hypothetical protein
MTYTLPYTFYDLVIYMIAARCTTTSELTDDIGFNSSITVTPTLHFAMATERIAINGQRTINYFMHMFLMCQNNIIVYRLFYDLYQYLLITNLNYI